MSIWTDGVGNTDASLTLHHKQGQPMTTLEKMAWAIASVNGKMDGARPLFTRYPNEADFEKARAALAAMREPSEAVAQAGASHWWVEIDGPTSDRQNEVAAGSFRAMIDAILEGK